MTTRAHEDTHHDSAEHLAQLPVEPEMPESLVEEAAEKVDVGTTGSATAAPVAPR